MDQPADFCSPSRTPPPPTLQVYTDGGLNIPGCCPEGVLFYSQPQAEACNTNVAESAYSLELVST